MSIVARLMEDEMFVNLLQSLRMRAPLDTCVSLMRDSPGIVRAAEDSDRAQLTSRNVRVTAIESNLETSWPLS